MPKKTVKRKVKKVKQVKNVKNVNINLPDVLKKAQSLPPNERKIYLKKFVVSFLKGIALAAGAATAATVIYKVNKKNINNEVRYVINTGGDELRNQAKKTSPIIENEMNQILNNIQPNTDRLVENSIKKGFDETKKQIINNKTFLNETVEELGVNAAKGATQGTGGIIGMFTGQGGERKKNLNNGPKNQRELNNLNRGNILPGKTRNDQKLLNKQNDSARVIQSKFRQNLAKRELNYNRELKKYNESKPFLGFFKGPAPLKGAIYNKQGIQEVKFGKRVIKKHLKLN